MSKHSAVGPSSSERSFLANDLWFHVLDMLGLDDIVAVLLVSKEHRRRHKRYVSTMKELKWSVSESKPLYTFGSSPVAEIYAGSCYAACPPLPRLYSPEVASRVRRALLIVCTLRPCRLTYLHVPDCLVHAASSFEAIVHDNAATLRRIRIDDLRHKAVYEWTKRPDVAPTTSEGRCGYPMVILVTSLVDAATLCGNFLEMDHPIRHGTDHILPLLLPSTSCLASVKVDMKWLKGREAKDHPVWGHRLHTLVLTSLFASDIPLMKSWACRSSLRKLELEVSSTVRLNEVEEMVSLFPRLESLTLGHIRVVEAEHVATCTLPGTLKNFVHPSGFSFTRVFAVGLVTLEVPHMFLHELTHLHHMPSLQRLIVEKVSNRTPQGSGGDTEGQGWSAGFRPLLSMKLLKISSQLWSVTELLHFVPALECLVLATTNIGCLPAVTIHDVLQDMPLLETLEISSLKIGWELENLAGPQLPCSIRRYERLRSVSIDFPPLTFIDSFYAPSLAFLHVTHGHNVGTVLNRHQLTLKEVTLSRSWQIARFPLPTVFPSVEKLTLQEMTPSWTFEESIVELVRMCPHLHTLQVHMDRNWRLEFFLLQLSLPGTIRFVVFHFGNYGMSLTADQCRGLDACVWTHPRCHFAIRIKEGTVDLPACQRLIRRPILLQHADDEDNGVIDEDGLSPDWIGVHAFLVCEPVL